MLSCEGPGLAAGARPTLLCNVLMQQTWPADTGLLQECVSRSREALILFQASPGILWSTVGAEPWELKDEMNKKEPIKGQIPGERTCNKHKGEIQRDLRAWALVNPWSALSCPLSPLWKLLWFQHTHAREGWKTWAWSWAELFFLVKRVTRKWLFKSWQNPQACLCVLSQARYLLLLSLSPWFLAPPPQSRDPSQPNVPPHPTPCHPHTFLVPVLLLHPADTC